MEQTARSSKQSGGPRIAMRNGRLVVVQNRLVGWILLAIGVGAPALILVSERRFRRDPAAYLSGILDGLGWGSSIMAFLGGSLLLLLALYGLFWLLWVRQLVIDSNSQRLQFRTGLWPFVKTIDASTREIKTIHLWRKVVRPMKSSSASGGGAPGVGYPLWESWEVRLAVPGSGEPLFLGEWGLRDGALEEIERWKKILPGLVLEEGDSRPDVPRAAE